MLSDLLDWVLKKILFVQIQIKKIWKQNIKLFIKILVDILMII